MKESKSCVTIRRRQRKRLCESNENMRASLPACGVSGPRLTTDDIMFQQLPFDEPRILRLMLSSQKTLFLGLLAFRVTNALMIQTSFVPDEYWQSLEVAHNMAFGYGHMTWEWKQGIRGYSYPLIFAFFYRILSVLQIDSRLLLLKLPRILQGGLAACGDLYLYKLSAKLSGHQVAPWSLFCQLTSWFTFYCCTRTLTNSTETVLTTVALYYFPWPGKTKSVQWKYVMFAGLAFIVRPTAAVVWVPLVLWHTYMHRHTPWRLLRTFLMTGLFLLYISSLVDRVFYGRWLSVHYNFVRFNVGKDIASFYGSHSWHWYLSQGLLVVMATHIFPFILAVRNATQPVFLGVIAWTVLVFSLLPHKEFRFLMPVLPMTFHVCGCYLYRVTQSHSSPLGGLLCCQKAVIFILIVTNLPLALYTSVIHQRGTVDVMKFLHDETRTSQVDKMNVLYLMPCHSTPYYSYIHRNISMRFLHCEPNIEGAEGYRDEADIFYDDPPLWLNQTFPSIASFPTHVVMFDCLQLRITNFLERHHYRPCAEFFHTHMPEGRVGAKVIVSCHTKWRTTNKQTNGFHKTH